MNNAPLPDIVVELDIVLSSAELQRAWEAERRLSPLPNLSFTGGDHRVVMHFCSDHGSLPGIQEIKRAFTIAMHRKNAFPRCKIYWPS